MAEAKIEASVMGSREDCVIVDVGLATCLAEPGPEPEHAFSADLLWSWLEHGVADVVCYAAGCVS